MLCLCLLWSRRAIAKNSKLFCWITQWTWQAHSCCVVLICCCCYIRVHGVVLCCASLFSSSLQLCCPSSGHRDRIAGVGFPSALFYVCIFEDKRLDLVDFVPTQQLALPPSAALQSLLLALPFSLYHSRVCFSCIFCLVLLSPDLFEKVNAARLPAAESALMLFCQPGPASLSHPHLPPHSFWHVTLSGHSQQHWRLARTLTSHRFTWAFNSCPNKPDRTPAWWQAEMQQTGNKEIVSLGWSVFVFCFFVF